STAMNSTLGRAAVGFDSGWGSTAPPPADRASPPSHPRIQAVGLSVWCISVSPLRVFGAEYRVKIADQERSRKRLLFRVRVEARSLFATSSEEGVEDLNRPPEGL